MMGRRQEAARRLLLRADQVKADPPSPARLDKNLQQQQAFDSSMGLTVLALLTAIFFMGFFSVYIRRFAHDSPVDLSRRRRRPGSSSSPYSTSYSFGNNNARFCTHKGLHSAAIQSLPVLTYSGAGFPNHHPAVVDCCTVCLAEFGEGDCVKMLPPCRHFFHPECIDTWLLSRASCPVCRASRLFVELKQDEQAARGGEATAEGVGGDAMRRCCSCSNLVVNERGGLQRTRSF
uniref:RING-type E3 ubiquitin transferase n=1 Tax=Kalanchoe fedtschenkoi TaxID=63787 RepID=A0A7N0SW84_KALFE